jgi:hypothetical protein
MKKREIISEILGKRHRLSNRRDAYGHAEKMLNSLIYAYLHLQPLPREEKEIKEELLRYFSVGLVSCLEGYYRSVIKELVDYGSPYRDNVQKLDELKFDIRTFAQMHEKKISTGEVVSHLVSISSFDDIQRHMSVLLGCDYFSKLKQKKVSNDRIYCEFHPRAWETLASVFSDRHIACHELNPRVKWKFKVVVEQWRIVWHTIEANERLLKEYGLRDNND